jgi:peptidoglycan biosynthesis protein MviN/MurJ (putative lipid II flippase)
VSIEGPANRSDTSRSAGEYRPPPLPPVRANLAHIVIPLTALWFVGFVVLLFFREQLRANDSMIYLWTCLAGGVLGCIGLSIYFWQRSAARRGRKSANQMALEEKL